MVRLLTELCYYLYSLFHISFLRGQLEKKCMLALGLYFVHNLRLRCCIEIVDILENSQNVEHKVFSGSLQELHSIF